MTRSPATPARRDVTEAAMIMLTAELVGALTGLKTPTERSMFPPQWLPALTKFIDGAILAVRDEIERDARLKRGAA